jgi:pimeloyl-ACP methyl ester carboxylesterase
MPKGSERVSVDTPDGETLVGIHIPPAAKPDQRPLVLGFGGNAWNGQDVAEYLHELYPKADVVAFHYRGYRPSTGRASAEDLIADAPLVFDEAVARIKPKRLVTVGFSIGTGIGSTLAGKRKFDGLILVTPFDSLKAVAQGTFPWLPVGPFFQHEIDAGAALKGVNVPTAIIEAERDELIPSVRTDALRPQVPNLVFDRTIAGAGHNDIYARKAFQDAMHEALDKVLASK